MVRFSTFCVCDWVEAESCCRDTVFGQIKTTTETQFEAVDRLRPRLGVTLKHLDRSRNRRIDIVLQKSPRLG